MSPRRAAALRDGQQSLREHLIAAAERLIARSGTAGLTVRDIAREAGVADGVLYNHFADKEELLAYALHAHVRAVERTLGEPPGPAGHGTVEANLRGYLTHGLALHAAILPALAGLLTQPKVLDQFGALPNPMTGGLGLRAALAGYLRAEQELGRIAPDATVDAVATMIVGVCHDVVLSRLLGVAPGPAELTEWAVDGLVATLLNGIAGPVLDRDRLSVITGPGPDQPGLDSSSRSATCSLIRAAASSSTGPSASASERSTRMTDR